MITEEEALRYGSNHYILAKNFDENNMKASIEQLAFSIKKNKSVKINKNTLNEIKIALKRFCTSSRRVCYSYKNQAFYKTLKNLANDNTIKIRKFFLFFYFYLYIYPHDSQESDGGAIHRASNYPDLLPEMPRYCCPLVI